jgi:hypothetical protein
VGSFIIRSKEHFVRSATILQKNYVLIGVTIELYISGTFTGDAKRSIFSLFEFNYQHLVACNAKGPKARTTFLAPPLSR